MRQAELQMAEGTREGLCQLLIQDILDTPGTETGKASENLPSQMPSGVPSSTLTGAGGRK